jgi:hypothetical protein
VSSETLKQALRDTLAGYLATQLASGHPNLVVSKSWPTPGATLPKEALTVLAPGQPVTEYHPPRVWSTTPTTGVLGIATYSYGVATVGMQLDAWSEFSTQRDQLALDVEAQLNRNMLDTLGVVTLPHLSRRGGLVLPVSALANAKADFRFQAAPRYDEASDSAQAGEWRATWTGDAFVHLLTQEQVTLLKHILLDFGGGDVVDIH